MKNVTPTGGVNLMQYGAHSIIGMFKMTVLIRLLFSFPLILRAFQYDFFSFTLFLLVMRLHVLERWKGGQFETRHNSLRYFSAFLSIIVVCTTVLNFLDYFYGQTSEVDLKKKNPVVEVLKYFKNA